MNVLEQVDDIEENFDSDIRLGASGSKSGEENFKFDIDLNVQVQSWRRLRT
jgi:hypothetical protein